MTGAAAISLSERLRAGIPLTAVLVKMPCTSQVEAAAYAGFDLVVLDTEHGPAGGIELENHVRAARAVGLPVLVRVPEASRAGIPAALDAGATGVVVPHVLDAADAERAVVAAHYPPRGRRGLATTTPAGGYGSVALDEHLRRAAEETCVVVQIEDAEAVGHADRILSVPNVSAALIGMTDLAMSFAGQTSSEGELEAATELVLQAARRRLVPVVAVASSTAEAAAWRARGVSVIASVAVTLVQRAFAVAARETKGETVRPGHEPLVLLPGMLGDAGLWGDVVPRLTEHAAPRPGRIDLDDTVVELAESVLADAPERFALAGHSLGGIVALEVARRAPERVTRLALLNTSARSASEAQVDAWETFRTRAEAGEFPAVAHELALSNVSPHRRGDTQLVDRVESMARAIGAEGLLRQLAAQRARPDSRPTLATIAVPTLVLSGAADDVCPTELQEELAAGIPDAEHVTIEGAGHMAVLEDPVAVAGHLLTWLGR